MKRTVCLGYLLAASLVSGFVPAVAMAQDSNDAFSQYMLEGVRYFKEGQTNPAMYEKAIESFENARKIDDIPDINYNIGRCHHMLGNCQQAAEYYRKYASVSDANAEVVKKYMDALNQDCGAGTLTVVCSSAPAKVKIDALPSLDCGEDTKEIALSPGTHTVVVSADGIVPQTQAVVVKANENAVVSFTLVAPKKEADSRPRVIEGAALVDAEAEASEAPASEPVAITENCGDDAETPTSLWFWSGFGAAGAGTLLSIIGGAVLANSHDEFVFSTGRNSGLITVYERDKSKYVGGQAVLGIGVSMTIVGVTLIVLDKFVFSKKKDSTTALVAPVINLSPDLAGAGVAVSF